MILNEIPKLLMGYMLSRYVFQLCKVSKTISERLIAVYFIWFIC